ncbi:MAG TPA: hypothetical protein VHW74_04225 [Mycobacteriales bacterium]|jgi:hypothetical protein|nr:hypothetical protein [Mycobacteriales bacterium]
MRQYAHRLRRPALVAAGVVLIGCSATACIGGSGLSASSTCRDFLNASPSAQQSIIDKLAAQYDKPDYSTPLGAPEVPYACSANPDMTLGQFFQQAED